MACHRRSSLAILLVCRAVPEGLAASPAVYTETLEEGDDVCDGGAGSEGLASCGVSLLQTHLNKIRRSRLVSADGGQDRSSTASFVERRGYIAEAEDLLVELATVDEAKKRCTTLAGCKGFTFANTTGDGQKEVHYKASSDVDDSSWTSFHLDATWKAKRPDGGAGTALTASGPPLSSSVRFEPVDGGSGRSCRGKSSTDSRPEYYRVEKAETLEACQQLCGAEAECKGVEYNKKDGHCELWTNKAGIGTSAPSTRFFACYRAVRLHTGTEAIGNADNATKTAPLAEHEQAHLSPFGSNASSLSALQAESSGVSLAKSNDSQVAKLNESQAAALERTTPGSAGKSNASKVHTLSEDAWDNDAAMKWSQRTEPTELNVSQAVVQPVDQDRTNQSSVEDAHSLLQDAWNNESALKSSQWTVPTDLNVSQTAVQPVLPDRTNQSSIGKAHSLLQDARSNESALKWSQWTVPTNLNVSQTAVQSGGPDRTNQSSIGKAHSLLQDAWDNELASKWGERTESTALVQSTGRDAREPQADALKDLYGTVSRYISQPDKNVLAYMRDMAQASDSDAPLQKTTELAALVQNNGGAAQDHQAQEHTDKSSNATAHALREDAWDNNAAVKWSERTELASLVQNNSRVALQPVTDEPANESSALKAHVERTESAALNISHAAEEQMRQDSANQSDVAKAHALVQDAWNNDLALSWSERTESTALVQSSDRVGRDLQTVELKDLLGNVSRYISSPDERVLTYMRDMARTPHSDGESLGLLQVEANASAVKLDWQLPPVVESAKINSSGDNDSWQLPSEIDIMSAMYAGPTVTDPSELLAESGSVPTQNGKASSIAAFEAQKREAILDAEKRLAELSKNLQGAQSNTSFIDPTKAL